MHGILPQKQCTRSSVLSPSTSSLLFSPPLPPPSILSFFLALTHPSTRTALLFFAFSLDSSMPSCHVRCSSRQIVVNPKRLRARDASACDGARIRSTIIAKTDRYNASFRTSNARGEDLFARLQRASRNPRLSAHRSALQFLSTDVTRRKLYAMVSRDTYIFQRLSHVARRTILVLRVTLHRDERCAIYILPAASVESGKSALQRRATLSFNYL